MAIKNHKLDWAEYDPSPNVSSGTITPRFLIMHYTAGYTLDSARNTFKNKNSKVSSQLIIGPDGEVVQMVPFNRRAWHAGPSHSHGYRDINSYGIGFEFVNIGYLRKTDRGFVDPYGKLLPDDHPVFDLPLIEAPEPRIGSGTFFWPSYTEAALDAGERAAKEIIAKYPTIEYIEHHEDIDTRGWKTDAGPAFPMKRFEQLLPSDRGSDGIARYAATTVLNVRSGAGTNWERIAQFAKGEVFTKLDQVGDWFFVSWIDPESGQEREGWVHSFYAVKV